MVKFTVVGAGTADRGLSLDHRKVSEVLVAQGIEPHAGPPTADGEEHRKGSFAMHRANMQHWVCVGS